jgi:hypothetical protein
MVRVRRRDESCMFTRDWTFILDAMPKKMTMGVRYAGEAIK